MILDQDIAHPWCVMTHSCRTHGNIQVAVVPTGLQRSSASCHSRHVLPWVQGLCCCVHLLAVCSLQLHSSTANTDIGLACAQLGWWSRHQPAGGTSCQGLPSSRGYELTLLAGYLWPSHTCGGRQESVQLVGSSRSCMCQHILSCNDGQ